MSRTRKARKRYDADEIDFFDSKRRKDRDRDRRSFRKSKQSHRSSVGGRQQFDDEDTHDN